MGNAGMMLLFEGTTAEATVVHCCSFEIGSERVRVTPPIGHLDVPHLECEEDNYSSKCDARVECCRGQVVVPRPPTVPIPSHQEHKHESDDESVRVKVREGWGHVGG